MPELHLQRVGDMLETRFNDYYASTLWSNIARLQLTPQSVRTYGHDLFDNVTQDAQLHSALVNLPEDERIVLLTEGEGVAAIPWEYMRLPESEGNVLLASRNLFVRSIPEANRKDAFVPRLPLTIVAVPVSPVDEERVLNTEGEWRDLARMVRKQGYSLKLTRTRPPTLPTMKSALSRKGTNIVQFMGHSGVVKGQGILLFEDDLANTQYVDVPNFKNFLNAQTFLVVLNSCQSAVTTSATSDKYRPMTPLSNIAESLVQRGIPYALGMQFSLPDDAALEITTRFYEALFQGSSVEEAVRDMRAALEQSNKLFHEATAYSDEINAQWLAGLPVLYTNQREAAPALDLDTGQPTIQPDTEQLSKTCNLNALPTPAHFVGRGDYISEALKRLLNPSTEGFVVLHGLGGIGKTALSRVIAERVSYHYDDHVFAYSFETFTRFDSEGNEIVNEQFAATFYSTLATYYGLDPRQYPDERTLQNAIITQRKNIRSLLVLDNIETLIEAQKRHNEAANQLASFVIRFIEDKNVVLLTSRDMPPSAWGHCTTIELGGLDDSNGAKLFLTSLADDRRDATTEADRIALAHYVKGHPLSIRLLAGRFSDDSAKSLHDFLTNVQNELASARQKTLRGEDPNRHATLSECLEYSIRRLTDEQKKVLYTVGIFIAPLLPEWVEYVLDDEEQTRLHLQDLMRLGLLEGSSIKLEDGELILLEMHPMLRQHIKAEVDRLDRDVRERYGLVYKNLARQAWEPIGGYDSNAAMRYLLIQSLPDCEAALQEEALSPTDRSSLAYHLAQPYERRGQVQRALALYEWSLTISQKLGDMREVAIRQGMMARLLEQQGQMQAAIEMFEQSLAASQELNEVRDIAVTQGAMADVLVQQGRIAEAMTLYEQSLTTDTELGDKREIAVTQHAMANVLRQQGEIDRAMQLYHASLKICQEIGEVSGISAISDALAGLLQQQGKIEEAIQLYQESLEANRKIGNLRGIAITLANYSQILWSQKVYIRSLTLIWEAYTSLPPKDFPRDSQSIQDIIILLKENFPDNEQQFDTLWLQATSTPQPGWLRTVQAGSSNNASTKLDEATQTILEAIAAFVNTPDWDAAQNILEERQDILFQDEAEVVFEQEIARFKNDDRTSRLLKTHLAILRDCKAHGIDETFAEIKASQQTQESGQEEQVKEIMDAIAAFVNTNNWDESQKVLTARQAILFQPEVEVIFEQNIKQYKADGQQQAVKMLTMHLEILRACKADGIEETFERIKAMQAGEDEEDDGDDEGNTEELSEQQAAVQAFLASLPFDAELIPRSIAALSGNPQEKIAHMQYLTSLTVQSEDEQLKALVNAIQLAMFGGDMAQLGEGLSEVYKVSWDIIVANVGT